MAELTTLDIDVGNTRAKWRLGRGGACSTGAIDHLGSVDALSALPVAQPDRVRVASVASLAGQEQLPDWLQRRYGVIPAFAKTAKVCGDVTCAYADPSRLGVDRWLAMLAVRRLTRHAFVVADLGTAATLDFVDASGLHRGGYIVPGVRLMVDSLLRRTADVKVALERPTRLEPASNTVEGVNRGAIAMLRDFVAGECERFQVVQSVPVDLFITGGDADTVAPHVHRANRVMPDLVLDGLSIAIP